MEYRNNAYGIGQRRPPQIDALPFAPSRGGGGGSGSGGGGSGATRDEFFRSLPMNSYGRGDNFNNGNNFNNNYGNNNSGSQRYADIDSKFGNSGRYANIDNHSFGRSNDNLSSYNNQRFGNGNGNSNSNIPDILRNDNDSFRGSQQLQQQRFNSRDNVNYNRSPTRGSQQQLSASLNLSRSFGEVNDTFRRADNFNDSINLPRTGGSNFKYNERISNDNNFGGRLNNTGNFGCNERNSFDAGSYRGPQSHDVLNNKLNNQQSFLGGNSSNDGFSPIQNYRSQQNNTSSPLHASFNDAVNGPIRNQSQWQMGNNNYNFGNRNNGGPVLPQQQQAQINAKKANIIPNGGNNNNWGFSQGGQQNKGFNKPQQQLPAATRNPPAGVTKFQGNRNQYQNVNHNQPRQNQNQNQPRQNQNQNQPRQNQNQIQPRQNQNQPRQNQNQNQPRQNQNQPRQNVNHNQKQNVNQNQKQHNKPGVNQLNKQQVNKNNKQVVNRNLNGGQPKAVIPPKTKSTAQIIQVKKEPEDVKKEPEDVKKEPEDVKPAIPIPDGKTKANANAKVAGQKRVAEATATPPTKADIKRRKLAIKRGFLIGGYKLPYVNTNKLSLPQPEDKSYAVMFFEQCLIYSTSGEELEDEESGVEPAQETDAEGKNAGRTLVKRIRKRLHYEWTLMEEAKKYKNWTTWWEEYKWCEAAIQEQLKTFGSINLRDCFIPDLPRLSTEQVVDVIVKSAQFGLEKNSDNYFNNMKSIITLMNVTFLENLKMPNTEKVQDMIRSVPNDFWSYKMRSMVYLWAQYHKISQTASPSTETGAKELQAIARDWKNPLFHWIAKQAFEELKAISEVEWPEHKQKYEELVSSKPTS